MSGGCTKPRSGRKERESYDLLVFPKKLRNANRKGEGERARREAHKHVVQLVFRQKDVEIYALPATVLS